MSSQLPDTHTEADEEPALRLFSIDIKTCSKCGGATGRHQVRCDAARVGCVGQAASTTNRVWRLLADKRPFRENDFDFFSGRFTANCEHLV